MAVEAGQLEIIGHGQIKSMVLPPGWVEKEEPEAEAAAIGKVDSAVVFHPPEGDAARICLYYRGYPLRVGDFARRFSELVAGQERALSSEELESLSGVVRNAYQSESFAVQDARVKSLNGRNVLVVEGQYTDSQACLLNIFIDVDGSGEQIQEIIFSGPPDQYNQRREEALASLESIEWETPPAPADMEALAREWGMVPISELQPIEPAQVPPAAPENEQEPDVPPGGIDLRKARGF